jgi:hypothetical protein
MDAPTFYPPNPLWKYFTVTTPLLFVAVAVLCVSAARSRGFPALAHTRQLSCLSVSNNSFGRLHLAAELFDIVLRCNFSIHSLWSSNNVFTGIQNRLRFSTSEDKNDEEQEYVRVTLSAARSKLQAAVHIYVNDNIKPKSNRVLVIPDAGVFRYHKTLPSVN